jgi:hypothetical protein
VTIQEMVNRARARIRPSISPVIREPSEERPEISQRPAPAATGKITKPTSAGEENSTSACTSSLFCEQYALPRPQLRQAVASSAQPDRLRPWARRAASRQVPPATSARVVLASSANTAAAEPLSGSTGRPASRQSPMTAVIRTAPLSGAHMFTGSSSAGRRPS